MAQIPTLVYPLYGPHAFSIIFGWSTNISTCIYEVLEYSYSVAHTVFMTGLAVINEFRVHHPASRAHSACISLPDTAIQSSNTCHALPCPVLTMLVQCWYSFSRVSVQWYYGGTCPAKNWTKRGSQDNSRIICFSTPLLLLCPIFIFPLLTDPLFPISFPSTSLHKITNPSFATPLAQ